MVAVNLNAGQKECELIGAYPSVFTAQPVCKRPEGTNRDVKTGVYLSETCECRLVPKYGEVPLNTAGSLNHRAQAFAGFELEEWDGIVDNDDADEKSGREGSAGRANARDSKSSGTGNASPERGAGGCSARIPDRIRVRGQAGIPGNGIEIEATWDNLNSGQNRSSVNEGGYQRSGSER